MTLTDKNRAMLNAMVRLLRNGNMTKQQLMSIFNLSERTTRDALGEIAKRVPLISVSDTSGYRIAVLPKDVGDAMHAYNENKKRAEEILKRNEPLERFIEENRE